MKYELYVLFIFWVFLLIYMVVTYNKIISSIQHVNTTSSTIDVMLKNRHDLIPNLIEVIKGYTNYEKQVLQQITALRSGYNKTSEVAIDEISPSLKIIFATAEGYPELKANNLFLELQYQLMEMEDRIQAARRTYNASVVKLKNIQQQFPSMLVAKCINIPDFKLFGVV